MKDKLNEQYPTIISLKNRINEIEFKENITSQLRHEYNILKGLHIERITVKLNNVDASIFPDDLFK